jgi:hypothetical protein
MFQKQLRKSEANEQLNMAVNCVRIVAVYKRSPVQEIKAAPSSEKPMNCDQTTWRQIPENSKRQCISWLD